METVIIGAFKLFIRKIQGQGHLYCHFFVWSNYIGLSYSFELKLRFAEFCFVTAVLYCTFDPIKWDRVKNCNKFQIYLQVFDVIKARYPKYYICMLTFQMYNNWIFIFYAFIKFQLDTYSDMEKCWTE